jgi:hypothetical protein
LLRLFAPSINEVNKNVNYEIKSIFLIITKKILDNRYALFYNAFDLADKGFCAPMLGRFVNLQVGQLTKGFQNSLLKCFCDVRMHKSKEFSNSNDLKLYNRGFIIC